MRDARYRDGVLTVIALLLGVLVIQGSGSDMSLTSTAHANQPGSDSGLVSASEQRKIIIAELRRMGTRLERMEAKMNAGLTVKVTEMPPIKLPKE